MTHRCQVGAVEIQHCTWVTFQHGASPKPIRCSSSLPISQAALLLRLPCYGCVRQLRPAHLHCQRAPGSSRYTQNPWGRLGQGSLQKLPAFQVYWTVLNRQLRSTAADALCVRCAL